MKFKKGDWVYFVKGGKLGREAIDYASCYILGERYVVQGMDEKDILCIKAGPMWLSEEHYSLENIKHLF